MSDTLIEPREGYCWVPAYTRPRCEKVVDEYCRRHDIACYLPLLRKARRYQRRTVETYLPMFRSYVFVQVSAETKPLLLQSHRVVLIYSIEQQREVRLIEELRGIQQMEALQTESELVVLPELSAGQTVRVCSGPLAGFLGLVERRRNRTRVTINVDLLGQSVVADLDVGELEIEIP